MRSKLITISIIIIVIVLIIFFIGQRIEQESQPFGQNQNDFDHLSSLTFSDYQGDSVSLADFEGKPLVVNSWAVWCPFCVKELEDFAELQEEFDGEIEVIAVNRAEPLEKAKSFTDELGLTDRMHFWLDSRDEFYRAIGGFGMPETLFITAQGQTVIHKRGPMDLVEMQEKITDIIK